MKAPIQKKQDQQAAQLKSEDQSGPGRVMSPPPMMFKSENGNAVQRTGGTGGTGGTSTSTAPTTTAPAASTTTGTTGGSAKVAKLHIHADIDVESMGLGALLQGQVGHAWVSLQWNDPTAIPDTVKTKYPKHAKYLQSRSGQGQFADPFGFWPYMFSDYDEALDQWNGAPDRVGYSSNPFDSYVKGQVVHPDQLHQGSVRATQSYDITEAEALNVMAYEQSKQGSDYSVFYYNCTTFAKEAVQAAGKTAPKSGHMGVCYPNKLYNSIKKNQKKGRGNTTVYESGGTNPTTVNGDTSPGKRNY